MSAPGDTSPHGPAVAGVGGGTAEGRPAGSADSGAVAGEVGARGIVGVAPEDRGGSEGHGAWEGRGGSDAAADGMGASGAVEAGGGAAAGVAAGGGAAGAPGGGDVPGVVGVTAGGGVAGAADGRVAASVGGDLPGAPGAMGSGVDGPVAGSAGWDVMLRVCGGLVAVVAAVVTAVGEIFFAPLRVGGVLVGLSVLGAVVANVALVRFTAAVAGGRWVVVPAIVWISLMIMASARSTEGDILLADNWVGLGTIFAGSIAFAGAAYRLILPKERP